MTTRRNFLAGGTAFGIALAGGARSCATADSYSISILGDTHFDAAPTSLYHGKWVPRHQNDWRDRQNEFKRNQDMWTTRLPRLIAAAAPALSSTARRSRPVTTCSASPARAWRSTSTPATRSLPPKPTASPDDSFALYLLSQILAGIEPEM